MLIPYRTDTPMARWPISNILIILATVVLGAPTWLPGSEYEGGWLVLWPDEFEPAQLIGSLFGHADFVHLAGNMFMLFVFGNAVNAKIGNIFYVPLYFAIGLIENLAWIALGDGGPTLGASGAVMGVIGAFLVLYPRNEVAVLYWFGWIAHGVWEISA